MVDCARWHDATGMLAAVVDQKLVRSMQRLEYGCLLLDSSRLTEVTLRALAQQNKSMTTS